MDIYKQTNGFLESCFHSLESMIPSPDIVEIANHKALRYTNKELEAAFIQKLARYISGLNASLLLLNSGYTQELGAIFRTLDEFYEDIVFLCIPNVGYELSELHKQYLNSFYQEEFDKPENPVLSTQNRPTIPRKKIRAAISNTIESGLNPHDSNELSRTLSQAYSGYIHGASIHIVEMIDSNPLRYFLSGMPGSYRQAEFKYNYWDYAYRGILAVIITAKALGSKEIADACQNYRDEFETVTGDTGQGDPEKLMKKIKAKKA